MKKARLSRFGAVELYAQQVQHAGATRKMVVQVDRELHVTSLLSLSCAESNQEARNAFQQHGYVYMRSFWNSTELTQKLAFLIHAYTSSKRKVGTVTHLLDAHDRETGRHVSPSMHSYAPFLLELVHDPRLARALEQIIGVDHTNNSNNASLSSSSSWLIHHDQIYFRIKVKREATVVHADLSYLAGGEFDQHATQHLTEHRNDALPSVCTVWIPLTSCAPQTGGLLLAEESHRIARDNVTDLYPSSVQPESLKWAGVEYQLGDVLVFDPRMIHAAASNQHGSPRISLDFRVVPSHFTLKTPPSPCSHIPSLIQCMTQVIQSYQLRWKNQINLLSSLSYHEVIVNKFLLTCLSYSAVTHAHTSSISSNIDVLLQLVDQHLLTRDTPPEEDKLTSILLDRCNFILAFISKGDDSDMEQNRWRWCTRDVSSIPYDTTECMNLIKQLEQHLIHTVVIQVTCKEAAITLCRDLCSELVYAWLQLGRHDSCMIELLHACESLVKRVDSSSSSSSTQRWWSGSVGACFREQFCYLLTHMIFVQTCYNSLVTPSPSTSRSDAIHPSSIIGLDVICTFLHKQLGWITHDKAQRTELLTECISVFAYHTHYRHDTWQLWHDILKNNRVRRPSDQKSIGCSHDAVYNFTHLTSTMIQAFYATL